MHRRIAFAFALLAYAVPARADDTTTDVRAELAASGDVVRLVTTSGSKKAGAKLELAKAKQAITLHEGELAGTLKTAHGKTVIALLVDDAKKPFRVFTLTGNEVSKPLALARPNKRHDFPYAVALTQTPDGFSVFFQEVETTNANEAHTYLVKLDKDGKVASEAAEIQVPWALADAAWNGKGYHLALFYTGNGMVLSMVSLDEAGSPQGHPDWSSQPGMLSDVHLVAADGKIRAIYRGGAGDRMVETDVTKVGQWGQVTAKSKDLGALPATMAIAITAKGAATKIKLK